MKLPKSYNSKEIEPKLQEWWEEQGIYKFDSKNTNTIYSIDTPPPTISGEMHMGHAFSYAQQDFIVRYKRMRGFSIFYPFGTDDNGLATERLVEQINNVKSEKMERSEFIKLCLKTLEKIRPKYIQDWKRIGMSCDWDIYYTTIDDHCRRISQKSFIDLYKDGREYQKEAPITWCPRCQTAIAQVEMKDKELESAFVYIRMEVEGDNEIVIATTRPELMPACVAVFVNPADKRYKHLIGKKVKLPIFNREVTIYDNKAADMEFGSGAVYHCTFGDANDIRWVHEYNLPIIEVMNKDGTLNEKAGKYQGLTSKEARKAIVKDLKKAGYVVKEEPLKHIVNVHERCGAEIEFIITKQWFIKYLDLKEEFLKYGKMMNWYPAFMRHRFDNWIKGLKWDWCISRQRHYGVPFPVWYCKKCGEVMLADEKQLPVDPTKDKPNKACKCGSKDFEPEKDVLDTWATSSLTPQLSAELFRKQGLFNKLYPMDLRPQAHDIITFWLFNTVVKSYLHEKKTPWKNIIISGFALDPHGKKMSKSLGNVVRPQEMIEKYSADCLRFWAASSSLGDDLPFLEKELVAGQKFITKLWNASKFALIHLEKYNLVKPELKTVDKWILSKLNGIIKECTDSFEKYEYSKTKLCVENFYWHEFCDNYLEIVKDRLYNPEKYDKDAKLSAQYTLYHVILTCLKLLAPILPHVTEEIFQLYFAKKEKVKSIHVSEWPLFDKKLVDKQAEEVGNVLKKLLAAIRQFKQKKALSLGAELSTIYLETKDKKLKKNLEVICLDLKGATRAKKVELKKGKGEKVEIDLPVELNIEV